MSNIDFQNGFALGVASKGQAQGGAELNIAYGDTEPDDTSKLWIKANEPESIVIGKDTGGGVESIENVGNTPTIIADMGCARVENKIYLFGGRNGSGEYNNLNTIRMFDTETQTITTLSTTLPKTCYGMGCVSIGTKIYLFGGIKINALYHTNLNTINVFDTETETITTLSTTLPKETYGMGCVSIGTKIYLFGGISYFQAGKSKTYYNTINVFDTETETITTLSTTLPTACGGMGCEIVGNKVYLFGGNELDTINVFDTETQTITTLSTTLPKTCYDMGCEIVGNKVYLFGGNELDTINVFDIETQSITTLSTTLPTACGGMGCASVGIKIYLFGGYGGNCLNTINLFTVSKELTQNNIEVITAQKNYFNVVNTDTMKVEIGVDSVFIGNAENQAENCEAYLYQNESWVQI